MLVGVALAEELAGGEAGAVLVAVAVGVAEEPPLGGVTVPPHALPLMVQLCGSPVPDAVNPNVAVAPAARLPFQSASVTV